MEVEYQPHMVSVSISTTNGDLLALIETKMNEAALAMECHLYHEHLRLYGALYCVACDRWTVLSEND